MRKTKPITSIMDVAERWKQQYCIHDSWSSVWPEKGPKIPANIVYDDLVSLHMYGSTDLDNVDKIIGNNSWTHNTCNVCGTQSRADMIVFDINGGEYEHNVCSTCLQKSLNLLQGKGL